MTEGIQVEIQDGFARIEFLDPAKRGAVLASLIAVGGPGIIDTDTSGRRKAYTVPASIAEQAGVIDPPKKVAPRQAVAKHAPRRAAVKKVEPDN